MSAFVLRYLGKVDIVGHPEGVEVHAKLKNLGRPQEQRLSRTFAYVYF